MNRLMANFIWGGKSSRNKIHLVKLDKISLPKKMGGWGLLDMRTFGRALLCKTLWLGIFGEGLWSLTIKKKYMLNRDMEFWYRRGSIGVRHGSTIWLSLRKIQSYFLKNLRWNLFASNRIMIGLDSIVGGCEEVLFPECLLNLFHKRRFFTWDKLISFGMGLFQFGKMPTSSTYLTRSVRFGIRLEM